MDFNAAERGHETKARKFLDRLHLIVYRPNEEDKTVVDMTDDLPEEDGKRPQVLQLKFPHKCSNFT